ncbi:MAG: hypothetical protein KBA86_03030 [Bacteroidales bacterium]|nr:hypothetical protein [Bacteroidales bacterium]
MEKNINKDKQLYMVDLIKLLEVFWKRKVWILSLVLLSVITVVLFTSPLFITPLYQSKVAFYPNNVIVKSDETPGKQVMMWCNSNDIKDSIIKKYHYKERYKLSKDTKALMEKYEENIEITLDKFYGNILVEVRDKDPKIAYAVANDIPIFLNEIIIKDYKRNYYLSLAAIEKSIQEKNKAIDSMVNLMIAYGVDYEIILQTLQGMEVTKGYLGTNEGSRVVDKEALKKLKTNLELKGPRVYADQQYFYSFVNQRNDLQSKYDALYLKIVEEINFLSIVEYPYVSKTKVYPQRIQMSVFAAIFSFIASYIFFLIIEINAIKRCLNRMFTKKRKETKKIEEVVR